LKKLGRDAMFGGFVRNPETSSIEMMVSMFLLDFVTIFAQEIVYISLLCWANEGICHQAISIDNSKNCWSLEEDTIIN
jgi:hypothetical protein